MSHTNGNIADLFASRAFADRTLGRITGIRNASLNAKRLYLRITMDAPVPEQWLRTLLCKIDIPYPAISGAAGVAMVRPFGAQDCQIVTNDITADGSELIPLPPGSTITIVSRSGKHKRFTL